MSVLYPGTLLETGFTYTVDDLELTISGEGTMVNYTSPPYEGVWIGHLDDTNAYYTLHFSEPVSSIQISLDGSNSAELPYETFSNFQVSLGGSSFDTAIVEPVNTGGYTLSGNTITTNAGYPLGTFTGGTFYYSGAPFDTFRFLFTQSGGNNGSVIEEIEVTRPEYLYLDFTNAIPVDFFVGTNTETGAEYVATRAGSEPLSTFTASEQAALVAAVQAIFDRSDLGVIVTSEEPPVDTYHSVRFGGTSIIYDDNADGNYGRLLGIAYEGVDRYNTNASDIVAVFMNSNDSPAEVAETIAHEAAHAFGVRHINPVSGRSSEVMDYHDSVQPVFTNSVAAIIEPPVDGETGGILNNHNPTYHIRRYVLGESDEDLRADGVLPGTWDVGIVNYILYTLSFSSLTEDLAALTLILDEDVGRVNGDATSDTRSVSLADGVQQGDTITFQVAEGTSFRLVASSGADDVSDVAIELGGSSGQTAENGETTLTGEVVRRASTGADPETIGEASAETEMGDQIGSDDGADTSHIVMGTEDPDNLPGDATSQVFYGLAGADTITGDGGADQLDGGAGDDELDGGVGNDWFSGGAGANTIIGGEGVDTLDFGAAEGRAFADLAIDQRDAGFLRFFTDGQAAGDVYSGIENVLGGAFADNLRGDSNPNLLTGSLQSDRLYGRGGNDTLDGGTGADAIYGNLGVDVMTGGVGDDLRDRFIYFTADESGVGVGQRDLITDFTSGEDRIELGRLDADVTEPLKQAFTFIGDAAFSGTAGELGYRFEDGSTIVQADFDGDMIADFEIELLGAPDLVEEDFLI